MYAFPSGVTPMRWGWAGGGGDPGGFGTHDDTLFAMDIWKWKPFHT